MRIHLSPNKSIWAELEMYHCRLTVCVTRWWVGRDNAILAEPTSSQEKCLKTRREASHQSGARLVRQPHGTQDSPIEIRQHYHTS